MISVSLCSLFSLSYNKQSLLAGKFGNICTAFPLAKKLSGYSLNIFGSQKIQRVPLKILTRQKTNHLAMKLKNCVQFFGEGKHTLPAERFSLKSLLACTKKFASSVFRVVDLFTSLSA